jgi:hypothetical protein
MSSSSTSTPYQQSSTASGNNHSGLDGSGSSLLGVDTGLAKQMAKERFDNVKTALTLPADKFDFASFKSDIEHLTKPNGVWPLFTKSFDTLTDAVGPAGSTSSTGISPEAFFQRVCLAYNFLEYIATAAKQSAYFNKQLALDNAEDATYGSRVKETFDELMKRIAATKGDRGPLLAKQWDQLPTTTGEVITDPTIASDLIRVHDTVCDRINHIRNESKLLEPPKVYSDEETMLKYLACIPARLNVTLDSTGILLHKAKWDSFQTDLPDRLKSSQLLSESRAKKGNAAANAAAAQIDAELPTQRNSNYQKNNNNNTNNNNNNTGNAKKTNNTKGQYYKRKKGGGYVQKGTHMQQQSLFTQNKSKTHSQSGPKRKRDDEDGDFTSNDVTQLKKALKLAKALNRITRNNTQFKNVNNDGALYLAHSTSVNTFDEMSLDTIDSSDNISISSIDSSVSDSSTGGNKHVKRVDKIDQIIVMPAFVKYRLSNEDFLVDSGANRHICKDRHLFTHFCPKTIAITVANGITEYAEGEGHIGDLFGVLYCPEFTYNILSVTAISTFYTLTIGPNKVTATEILPPNDEFVLASKQHNTELYFAPTAMIRKLKIPMTPIQRFIGHMETLAYFAYFRLTDAELWHQRLNHASNDRLSLIRQHDLCDDVFENQGAYTRGKRHHCDACGMCKSTRLPPRNDPGSSHQILQRQLNKERGPVQRSESTQQVIDQPTSVQELSIQSTPKLSKFCMDLHGPFPTLSVHKNRYMLLITDYHTRFRFVYMIQHKSPDTLQKLEEFISTITLLRSQLNCTEPIYFRSDNGGEFKSAASAKVLHDNFIQPLYTTPHTPHANGIAERSNRTIIEAAATMMLHMEVPTNLWEYAIKHAVYVENRLPTEALGNKSTPYFKLYGVKPSLAHLRTFGCLAYHVLPDQQQQYFGARAERGRFLGFDNKDSSHKLWYNIKDRTITTVRDLYFNELPSAFKSDAASPTAILNDVIPLGHLDALATQTADTPVEIPPEEPTNELPPALRTRSTILAQRIHDAQQQSSDQSEQSSDTDSSVSLLSNFSLPSNLDLSTSDNTGTSDNDDDDLMSISGDDTADLVSVGFEDTLHVAKFNSTQPVQSFADQLQHDNNTSTQPVAKAPSSRSDPPIQLSSTDTAIFNMHIHHDMTLPDDDSASQHSVNIGPPRVLTKPSCHYTFQSHNNYLVCYLTRGPSESLQDDTYQQDRFYGRPYRDWATTLLTDITADHNQTGTIGTFDHMQEGTSKRTFNGIVTALTQLINSTPKPPTVSIADTLNVTANSGQPTPILNLDSPEMQEALNHPDDIIRQKWHAAFNEEIDHLFDLGCFESVKDLPEKKRPTGHKFVFKIKPDKFKVRLTFKGFQQIYGSDFTDTFAPTVQLSLARYLLALIAHNGLYAQLVDIKAAFVNADLPDDIDVYMKIPKEVRQRRKETVNDIPDDHDYFRLRKALYGMKQASREWYKTLSGKLLSYGYTRARCDSCLFTLFNDHDNSWLMVYVDDMLVAGSSQEAIDYLVTSLRKDFELTVSPLTRFLGMDINYNRDQRTMTIDQERYAKAICEKHIGVHSALFKSTYGTRKYYSPMDNEIKIQPRQPDEEQCNGTHYRSLLGALQYLSLATRLDITYAVNQHCRVMSDPSTAHLTSALRILAYLQTRPDLGLQYSYSSCADHPDSELGFHAYADADHGGDPTTMTSRSGVILRACGGPIMWCSKQQNEPSGNGTAASEVKALYTGTQEVAFIRGVMDTLGIPFDKPTVLYTDSTSAEAFLHANNSRMKNLRIQYAEYEHHVSTGAVRIQHISTDDMLADLLTKSLLPKKFTELVDRLMWKKPSSDSR